MWIYKKMITQIWPLRWISECISDNFYLISQLDWLVNVFSSAQKININHTSTSLNKGITHKFQVQQLHLLLPYISQKSLMKSADIINSFIFNDSAHQEPEAKFSPFQASIYANQIISMILNSLCHMRRWIHYPKY